MFFLAYEKSMYHLLQKYLTGNQLLTDQISSGAFDRGLVARAQEFGFSDLESYCHFVMLQPFGEYLQEIGRLIGTCRYATFYQHKDQLDALTGDFIQSLTEEPEKKEEKKFSSKILKLLTSEVDFSRTVAEKNLNVLIVETIDGPEAYSVAMRITSVLPGGVNLYLIGGESDPEFLRKASEGKYPLPRMSLLSDNYRSLFTEKTPDGLYKIAPEVRKKCEFHRIDPLNDFPPADFRESFHLVFCNSPASLYPSPIALEIANRCIYCLKPGGYLFATSPPGKPLPQHNGIEPVSQGKASAHRRTGAKLPPPPTGSIDEKFDTVENRILTVKSWMLDGKLDKAETILKEILKDHISDLSANMLLGDIYLRRGEGAKAITQYDKAILINPVFLPARFNIAVACFSLNKEDQAMEQVDKIRGKLNLIDEKQISEMYSLPPGAFGKMMEQLENSLREDESIQEDKSLQWINSLGRQEIKVPDIAVPDKYGTLKGTPEPAPVTVEKAGEDAPTPEGPKKVVNISELPSTRDYGQHDPWAKKKAMEDETRRKSEEFKLLQEDYCETVKGKQVPSVKSRKRKKAPAGDKSQWLDMTGEDSENGKKPRRVKKPPKTQAVVRTRSPKTVIMKDDNEDHIPKKA